MHGWRAIALSAFAAIAVAGLLVARFHPAGLLGGGASGAQAKAPGSGGSSSAGNLAPAGNKSGGGVDADGAAAGETGQGGAGASDAKGTGVGGSNSSPPAAAKTPPATPTAGDIIYGKPDVLQSNCAAGYEPGQQCTVYYHGSYQLVSQPAGKVVYEVVIDDVVANAVTYVAPGGAHRYGGNLKFVVPPHAHKIVYDCMLEDASGKVLVKSAPVTTYGYG
jgi:hypothetical protein